jgi:hypothetical protein
MPDGCVDVFVTAQGDVMIARVARPDHEQQAGILGKFARKAAGRLNRAARSLVTICNQVGY